ncbi:MAG: IPT/TIG domain-containing protein [Gemmatimonadaceae bacterium]
MSKSNRLALLLALGLGCGEAPVEPAPVGGSLEILVPTRELRPGRVMHAEVRLLTTEGEPVEGARVIWRSLTPNTVQVDTAGQLLGIAPGAGTVRASVGALSAELALTMQNPPARTITLDAGAPAGTLRLSLPNGTRQLAAVARDSLGEPLLGVSIQWRSTAARIAAISPLGEVTAVAVGQAQVVAQADAISTTLDVEVVADPSPTAPVIDLIAPQVVIPGQTLVVNGSLFGATVGANTVLLDGVPVAVTQASATQLVLTIPPATSFVCAPRRTVALQVGTAGGIGVRQVPLEVATARTFERGGVTILTPAAAHCLDLSASPGRYRLAVVNAARAIEAPEIAPTLTGVVAVQDPVASSLLARAIRATPLPLATPATARRSAATRPTASLARWSSPDGAPRLVEPRVGELRAVRLPALGHPDLCARFTPITARVAWVGQRIAILEDTTTVLEGTRTLAGTQDALYAQVGAELDSLGWAIVRRFGDPLVMDGRLDDDGHVAVVLTPRMNTLLDGGVLAATVTCDLFPRAQFAASDMGEFIYAQVPTVAQGGDAPGTPARWSREMRATLVHELKHLASYAERVVRGQPLEESWLEEATARHAEELFARAIYGHRPGTNVGFATSLACEIAGAGCPDTPRAMQPHLEALYEMLSAPTARSPLGPTAPGDLSFYGSAWALTRWVLDQQEGEESAAFAVLTAGGLSGIANLEARAQRPWEELLPEWALTMMVDDAGFAVPSRLTFPSWHLRSQFRGLCEEVGRCRSPSGDPRFPNADPVRPTRLTPAALALATSAAPPELPLGPIVPGGFAPIDLTITAGQSGVVGVTGDGTLRLGLVRIE